MNANTIKTHWKWGLLALLVLALALTWGHAAVRPAEAGAPGLIIIEKVDRDTGGKLPGACFMLMDSAWNPIFEVCDNQPPDMDPTPGWIVFSVPVYPEYYRVEETVPPEGYNLKPIKWYCDFFFEPQCNIYAENDPKGPQINIEKVDKDDPGLHLAGSCWQVYRLLPDGTTKVPLDVVSDNNAKAECDEPPPPMFDLSDKDPADGFIFITIPADVILIWGPLIHVQEVQAPTGYTINDPTNYVCDMSQGKCELVIGNLAEASVGGVAELPEVAGAPLEANASSGPGMGVVAGIACAAAASVLGLGGAAWYVRRRRPA